MSALNSVTKVRVWLKSATEPYMLFGEYTLKGWYDLAPKLQVSFLGEKYKSPTDNKLYLSSWKLVNYYPFHDNATPQTRVGWEFLYEVN